MDEKIIQMLISSEVSNEIINSFLIEGELICDTYSNLIKNMIDSIYIKASKIKDIKLSMHLYEGGEINLDTWDRLALDIDNNYLNKSFILFLNKPSIGGQLIIKNSMQETSEVSCDENKLVIFPSSCEHFTTSSAEDRYVIEGKIYFDSKLN